MQGGARGPHRSVHGQYVRMRGRSDNEAGALIDRPGLCHMLEPLIILTHVEIHKWNFVVPFY